MFFFFNDPAPTEIYPLSLHDALPIYPHPRPTRSTSLGPRAPPNWRRLLGPPPRASRRWPPPLRDAPAPRDTWPSRDRKSTRLNSSHLVISYAVFCLKKKNNTQGPTLR